MTQDIRPAARERKKAMLLCFLHSQVSYVQVSKIECFSVSLQRPRQNVISFYRLYNVRNDDFNLQRPLRSMPDFSCYYSCSCCWEKVPNNGLGTRYGHEPLLNYRVRLIFLYSPEKCL